jgi:hypothetical protein
VVGPQPSQRGIAGAPQVGRAGVGASHLAGLAEPQAALRGDEHPRPATGQRLADQLLDRAAFVEVGHGQQRDVRVQRGPDGQHRPGAVGVAVGTSKTQTP